MKIFVDTNVLISSILFPKGKVSYVFSYIMEMHDLLISSYSLKECENVFKRKFPTKKDLLNNFINEIQFQLVETPSNIDYTKYPSMKDNNDLPILVSAIISDSDILITGDKDFEDISIKKPLIFTPNQYYDLIKKEDT